MLLEFQLDWIKIVDFLLVAKFKACLLFYYPYFKTHGTEKFKSQGPIRVEYVLMNEPYIYILHKVATLCKVISSLSDF